jgi:hypothetical protein
MANSLLPAGLPGYRGNCHTHTTFSDGAYSPDEVCRRYREAGYDFLYLTDHCDKLAYGKFPDVTRLDSPDLRVMPGVEYRNSTIRNGRLCECFITGLGTQDISFWRPMIEQQPVIDGVNAAGGIPIVSCTVWNGTVASALTRLRGVCGIEVFNANCEGHVAKGYSVNHWDAMLEAGMRVWGLAVDDAHFLGEWPDFAMGWIVVLADEKTPRAISAAIRAGRFYSSCGPEIREWTIDAAGTVIFRCSRATVIVANYETSYGRTFRSPGGEPITEAVFPLDANRRYLRLSCCDAHGRWAWTNPIWPMQFGDSARIWKSAEGENM